MNGSVLSFNGSYNTIMILITTVIILEEHLNPPLPSLPLLTDTVVSLRPIF